MDLCSINYGSEQTGLIWGYIFSPEGPARPVTSEDAIQWLHTGHDADNPQFLWLHVNLSNAASEKWMRRHAIVPEEFYEALHEGSRSTRIELVEGTLIAVVNDVLHDFTFDPSDISTLWVHVAEHVVVSARNKPLQSVERLRQCVQGGDSVRSTVELLVHLLRDQAEILVHIVRKTVAQVDDIEDALLAERLNHRRAKLGALRRLLVRLQRLLAPEPAALFRLLQRPPLWVTDTDLQELRQSTEIFRGAERHGGAAGKNQVAAGRNRGPCRRRKRPKPLSADDHDRAGTAGQYHGGPAWHECRWNSNGDR